MADRIRFMVEIDEKGRPILRQVGEEFDRLEGRVQKTGRGFRTLRSHWLALSAAMAAGIYMIQRIGRAFVEAAGEAEMFLTQLFTFEESIGDVNKVYQKLLDFAARTPHMTQDVVQSFIQLVSVGLNPTMQSMKTLGDVAFLFGRNIQDVGSALVSFEKEVLRRLGIEIDRVGEKARIMSGKMIIETENAAAAIRAGLLQVWETRFGGAMEKAEATWAGAVALYKSALWEMRKALGEAVLPALKLVLQALTNNILRTRDWAITHKTAIQNYILKGILDIINGLQLVTVAIEAVSRGWHYFRVVVDLWAAAVLKAFEVVVYGARRLLEALNIKGIFDSAIAGMKDIESIFGKAVRIYLRDTDKMLAKQSRIAEAFDAIRAALKSLGAEIEAQWPKLTALETGTGGRPGGPPPPGAPEAPPLPAPVLAPPELTEQHDYMMQAWDEEIAMMLELTYAQSMLREGWMQLVESEDLYIGMREGVKGAIQATIMGYESLGTALRKATTAALTQISSEAAVRAILHTAMGIAALTPWGAPVYGPASAQFKAAALFTAVAAAAGAAAKALAATPSGAERIGYEEGRGAAAAGGPARIGREGEPREYAQKWEVTIVNPIGTDEWIEQVLAPELKKVAGRDVEIITKYT